MNNKVYDNSQRCPWCGNVVKRPGRQNSELKCPHCSHHYSRQLDSKLFIILLVSIIVMIILYKTEYYFVHGFLILCTAFYGVLNISESPLLRSRDTVMPERGYSAEIILSDKARKHEISNNMIIPIVFVDEFDKAISSCCCVRVVNKEKKENKLILELRLLHYGMIPEQESSKIYMFNKYQIIASGNIIGNLDFEYR